MKSEETIITFTPLVLKKVESHLAFYINAIDETFEYIHFAYVDSEITISLIPLSRATSLKISITNFRSNNKALEKFSVDFVAFKRAISDLDDYSVIQFILESQDPTKLRISKQILDSNEAAGDDSHLLDLLNLHESALIDTYETIWKLNCFRIDVKSYLMGDPFKTSELELFMGRFRINMLSDVSKFEIEFVTDEKEIGLIVKGTEGSAQFDLSNKTFNYNCKYLILFCNLMNLNSKITISLSTEGCLKVRNEASGLASETSFMQQVIFD